MEGAITIQFKDYHLPTFLDILPENELLLIDEYVSSWGLVSAYWIDVTDDEQGFVFTDGVHECPLLPYITPVGYKTLGYRSIRSFDEVEN